MIGLLKRWGGSAYGYGLDEGGAAGRVGTPVPS